MLLQRGGGRRQMTTLAQPRFHGLHRANLMELSLGLVLLFGSSPNSGAAAPAQPAEQVRRVLHVCDCPSTMAASERAELIVAFTKLGYVHGTNLELTTHDVQSAPYERFLARQVTQTSPDLILASGIRVAEAAKDANPETPVVFWRLTDPVGRGLVASLARPQGKLTGFSRAIENLTVKRLELLHEMLPRARRVGFVFSSDNRSHLQQAAGVKAAGQSMGLEVIEFTLPASQWSQEPLDAMFSRIRQERIDAILLPDVIALPSTVVALVAKYRLPTIHSLTHVVTDWGGLAAYSTAPSPGMDDVAGYADRILRGARPANLPVQEAEKYELILNERAAREIGVSFPPTIMMRATTVLSK